MINTFIWILATCAFLIIESQTTALVSIWFAVGSVFALVSCVLGANVWVQLLTFVVFSGISVLFLRNIAVKKSEKPKESINLDRIIGQEVVITKAVDNESYGLAKINDVEWKVKSQSGELIEAGEKVKVLKIDGVKLIVEKIKEPYMAER